MIMRIPLALSLLLLACGAGEERVATRSEPAGDLFVHSPRAPRLPLERAERGDRAPELPPDAVLWTARLPIGSDPESGPAILAATDASGLPIESRIWIDPIGIGDFLSAEPVPLEPDSTSEGYFWTDAASFAFPVAGASGTAEGSASFRLLLEIGKTGGRVRLYPAETRTGVFPRGGTRFLLYDNDRNGIYDHADRLVIDANGDGTFDGNRNSIELYAMDEPFLLGDASYRIASVAWDGSSVVLARSSEEAEARRALLPGDPAPDFTLPRTDGEPIRFAEARAGRPTLLSYWATW
ncbi:MAG: hypothetical protein FJY73_03625 [Candidatus Eisenbacteria bacterium]|nr:hypothetical protein [Candidatus Eisenbacteria bacterium]